MSIHERSWIMNVNGINHLKNAWFINQLGQLNQQFQLNQLHLHCKTFYRFRKTEEESPGNTEHPAS